VAAESDLTEAASGVDTRVRQARSLVRDTDLPSRPSLEGARGRVSGVSDYTLRIGPSARYWESGGVTEASRSVDVGDFEGLDVDGVLGDVDNPRSVETDLETETRADIETGERDAGEGMVALESKSRVETEPLDTTRTGTGTDAFGTARKLPISRSVSTAFERSVTDEVAGPAELENPLGRLETAQAPTVDLEVANTPRQKFDLGSPFDMEFDTRDDIETDLATDTDLDVRPRTRTDLATEFETETEQELEFEVESEPRRDVEWAGDRARRRRGGDPLGGRTARASYLERSLKNPFTGE
jgi:hypothetical protein